jgi:hypothetical protein
MISLEDDCSIGSSLYNNGGGGVDDDDDDDDKVEAFISSSSPMIVPSFSRWTSVWWIVHHLCMILALQRVSHPKDHNKEDM